MKYCARFILFLPLFVSTAITAYANANTQNIDMQLSEAVLTFEKKEYEKAYKLLKEIYVGKSDDPKINFYLGLCAFELKKYDEAALALERTLIMEPSHARARLELAKTYFEQKDYQSAEAEFDEVLSVKNIPKEVADNIEIHKQIINAKKQKHYTNGYLSIGIGYDSNINNAIGLKDYTVPIFGGLSLTGDVQKEDYFHTQTVGINHIYDMRDTKDGMFWQSNILLYGQTYRHYIENNVRYASLTTGPGYKNDIYEINTPLTIEKLEFGGQDYMKSIGIAPKISLFPSNSIAINAGYAAKKKLHYYDNHGKNSIYQELSLGAKKFFQSTGSALSATYTLAKETELTNDQTDPISRTDVSLFTQTIGLSLYQPILYGIDLSVDIGTKKTAYSETNTVFGEKEQDQNLYCNVGIYKSIFKNSFVGLASNYSNNKSNFANKVYQKRGFTLNYISNFQ